MIATFTWVLGAALILSLLAVFLWSAHNKQKRSVPRHMPSAVREEFAEELAVPVSFPPQPAAKPQMPEIPWHYGLDRMVLMVRDPNWIFAYWEISATKQQEFSDQYGSEAWKNSRSVLRVYDITGVDSFNGANANDFTDISINDYVDSWHINVARPNSTFCVDLGRLFPDGTFITLLRSNIVQTPGAAVSNLLDEEWMWIEGIYRTFTRLYMGSSPMLAEEAGRGMGLIPLGISSPGPGNRKN
ncbi:DUF4912 domain-containing protein [Desulfoscipio sp. XC116]|uniref:DUF4912 domain-containing protein n=1 Tax=Desulfoscipio sp. XC116 TaxID=3144975 RepID=UPI00325B54FB